MKFSIVTLAFKQRKFLKEAMDSVLSQDYPDIEYIVIEPGSNDGSRELIEEYGDQVAYTIFEPDRGAADGLNKGFEKATGEVFAFLNGDDLLLPHAVRRVADFIDRNPDCDLVMGDGFIADAQGNPVRHVKATGFSVKNYVYGGSTWLQQSTFFRRRAFEAAGGFNAQNFTCWDGELFVTMVSKGSKVGFLHSDIGIFRIHGGSITGSRRAEQAYLNDSERIFRKFMGRTPRKSDRYIGILCRAERFMRDPLELVKTVKYRIKGRPQ
jgi:glycosyltransferase involved in cell wall biosynthesis